ncbi:hypothetical protein BDR26DRAFT_848602 [Obelidium mucronatum]|nr:hypothetical protein BDR26DRAFT_848602 [Obelidium mucronatum]
METFWGIELLRERNVLMNHLKRFQAGGGYDNMLEKCSEFCVIDFRRMKNGVDWKLDDLYV